MSLPGKKPFNNTDTVETGGASFSILQGATSEIDDFFESIPHDVNEDRFLGQSIFQFLSSYCGNHVSESSEPDKLCF